MSENINENELNDLNNSSALLVEEDQTIDENSIDDKVQASTDAVYETLSSLVEDIDNCMTSISSEELISLSAEVETEGPQLDGTREQEYDELPDDQLQESLWQIRTGLNVHTLCGAIETIVFMSDRPVPLKKIKILIDDEIPLRYLHEAISTLQKEYESKHHGIRLLEVAEGYQFRTKATYSKYVQDLFKVNSLVLTPTALEVLAIVAYKQPVSRTEIDKIRGVDSSHVVRGLIDKRLVKISGRSDDLGKPVTYGTTLEFMEVFNLTSLDQLPTEYELETVVDNDIGKASDIKQIVSLGDKTFFDFDELDELDQLSGTIKSISADTGFTKQLRVEEKRRVSSEGEICKSAFEILEEFINKKVIADQNRDSSDSALPAGVAEPLIVSDLFAKDLNAPGPEEEFQMVDLDTGEVIADEAMSPDVISDSGDIEMDASELFQPADQVALDEEAALEDELDRAFSRLTEDPLFDEESKNVGSELLDAESELENVTQEIMEKAKEFDIDLDLLSSENSSEVVEDIDLH